MSESERASALAVARGFDRGSSCYDEEARVQGELGEVLCLALREVLSADVALRVHEIGCGTGRATKALLANHFAVDAFRGLDLSRDSLSVHQTRFSHVFPKATWEQIDAEFAEVDDDVDLVFGNAVVQWFSDLGAFFRRCRGRSSRVLAFSSFGPETLRELRESYALASGRPFQSPVRYYSEEEVRRLLEDAGWRVVRAETRVWRPHFVSLRELLLHLKKTGVVPLHTGITLTPDLWTRWQEVVEETVVTSEGIPCTWEGMVWVCSA